MAVTLTARERRRLLRAHENGYLDATCRDHEAVVKAHGLWCWRLKIPMVWFERQSPHSGFGRLRVDMLTTPHMLTGMGETALRALGADQISPHDAAWERVRLPQLSRLAHAAFRAAIQPQNYRLNGVAIAKIDVGSSKALKLVPHKIASGE